MRASLATALFALAGLAGCDATPTAARHGPARALPSSPRDVAFAAGLVPVASDARGLPRLLRAGPHAHVRAIASTATATARGAAYVAQLAPAWGVPRAPDLRGTGEVPIGGGTIVWLAQELDGIPIDRAEMRVLVRPSGDLAAISGTLLDAATPRAAVWNLDEAAAIARAGGDARATRIWFGDASGLAAAWRVEAGEWRTVIAADDGRVLSRVSLAAYDSYSYRVFADADTGLPRLPLAGYAPHATGKPDGSYPPTTTPILVTVDGRNHPSGGAGPDPWLPPGSTQTVGNNADAYVDLTMPDGLSAGDFRASTTSAGMFDRAYDLTLDPTASQNQQMATIASVFYTVNWLHDFWYDAGFVEAAGNAQQDNYGRGGVGGDPLHLEAQDGGTARNNAKMVTPGDGASPKMEVYIWSGVNGLHLDGGIDSQLVAHEFGHYVHHRLSTCESHVCLAMSEGWADFDALLMTARPGDDLHGAYPVAPYATPGFSTDAAYYGIRRLPYSVDPAIDGLSYRNMRRGEPPPTGFPFDPKPTDNDEAHNAGEVWTSALWDTYVALQDAGAAAGVPFETTHTTMARYVVAGLALAPADGTPTEIRDALLTAIVESSPADADVLAAAFAKRGMGTCAQSAPSSSETLNEIVESTTVNGALVTGAIAVDDTVVTCDADGILDAGETARITVALGNAGYVPLGDVTATLVSHTPGLVVTSTPVAIPSLAAFDTTSATFEVALSDATATEADLELQIATPDGCTAMTTLAHAMRVNVDELAQASADDPFDSAATTWTAQSLLASSASRWARARRSASDGYWAAPSVQVAADDALVSPPMTAGREPVTLTITHRFAFAPDDGAVIEYTTDAGATWTDVATLGATGYTGVIRNYGSSLDSRPGFVDASAGYPAPATATFALGTALAGQTFQLRFRLASSSHVFLLDTSPGWELDDVAITGAGTPFPAIVADPGTCNAVGPGSGSGSGSAAPPQDGDGGCNAGTSGSGSVALVLLALALTRRTRRTLALVTLLAVAACADPKPSVYPTQDVYVEDTTAGASDLLEIRVAKQDQLSGDYEIDATGTISFPYAGVIASAGKTPIEIQTEIQTRLADGYLRDPQVTVRIKERHSKKISVFGEVRRGTSIPFADGMSIAEAVAIAGGFTPRAWENAVKVKRRSSKGIEEFTVPVKNIVNGSAPPFYMRPGDSVYVPKSPM